MKTILFQGDSITDADRCREDDNYMGAGYAVMTAGMVGTAYPGQYTCLNRGISGNRSVDLYARVKCDIINLKPDILTILIGVNDTWHEVAHHNGVSVKRYETLMDLLICDVKEALPNIKIVLLEPFVMLGSGTEEYYDAFVRDVADRQAVCRRLAEKHALAFVPLQKLLEDFEADHPGAKVLIDGVHPNYVGHKLMADALFQALQPIL